MLDIAFGVVVVAIGIGLGMFALLALLSAVFGGKLGTAMILGGIVVAAMGAEDGHSLRDAQLFEGRE